MQIAHNVAPGGKEDIESFRHKSIKTCKEEEGSLVSTRSPDRAAGHGDETWEAP